MVRSGADLLPPLGIKRYVQSHYVTAPEMEAALAARGWDTRPDALTETWWDSIEDFYAAMRTPEGIAPDRELDADEEVFCDMTKMQAFMT